MGSGTDLSKNRFPSHTTVSSDITKCLRRFRGCDDLLHLCDHRIDHGGFCYCEVHGVEEDRP